MKKLDDAEKCYQQSINLSKYYKYPYNGMGNIYRKRNQLKEAV